MNSSCKAMWHVSALTVCGGLVFVLRLANPQELSTKNPYETRPAKAGEICAIGGDVLTDHDLALLVRGRRVPVCRPELDKFIAEPEKYFARLQPRSALFQESMTGSESTVLGGVSSGWFLLGTYILLGLLCGGLSGYVAVDKGRSPYASFFIGFFLGIFGFIYVLLQQAAVASATVPAGLVKVPVTPAPVPCSQCGTDNHPSATKCSGCGATLEPLMQSDVAQL